MARREFLGVALLKHVCEAKKFAWDLPSEKRHLTSAAGVARGKNVSLWVSQSSLRSTRVISQTTVKFFYEIMLIIMLNKLSKRTISLSLFFIRVRSVRLKAIVPNVRFGRFIQHASIPKKNSTFLWYVRLWLCVRRSTYRIDSWLMIMRFV